MPLYQHKTSFRLTIFVRNTHIVGCSKYERLCPENFVVPSNYVLRGAQKCISHLLCLWLLKLYKPLLRTDMSQNSANHTGVIFWKTGHVWEKVGGMKMCGFSLFLYFSNKLHRMNLDFFKSRKRKLVGESNTTSITSTVTCPKRPKHKHEAADFSFLWVVEWVGWWLVSWVNFWY